MGKGGVVWWAQGLSHLTAVNSMSASTSSSKGNTFRTRITTTWDSRDTMGVLNPAPAPTEHVAPA
jgi:hypothetical protein